MAFKGYFTLSKVSNSFSDSVFYFEGLAILHCVVADGNTTRTPETNGSLCGAPGENCTGNAYASELILESYTPRLNFLKNIHYTR